MKSITLYLDEELIEAAEAIARAENTTLNELFCRWLADYVGRNEKMKNYDEAVKRLPGKFQAGDILMRDEMQILLRNRSEIDEDGWPVLKRQPGDNTIITDEFINKLREEEGI